MTKRYLLYVIFMMCAITLVAFILNLLVLHPPSRGETFIPQNQVVSVAIYHDQKPYILNVSQQHQLIDFINRTSLKSEISKNDVELIESKDKISIQRFRRPPISIQLFGKIDDQYIFTILDENKELYIMDTEKKIQKFFIN